MASIAAVSAHPAGGGDRLPASAWAWALYQGCRDPSNMVVNIYVFVPYFAGVVVGDPVAGQARVAQAATTAGLLVALTAPLLGSALDRLGARKPWLALVTAVQALLLACLWFAAPGGTGLSVGAVVALLVGIGLCFQWADVLFSALLPGAAPAALTPRASGLAQALGNALSVLVLVAVLWLFVLPGKTPLPGLPARPLLGLDPAFHEAERFVGPLVAALLALGAVPLFLFTPDAPRRAAGAWSALAGAPAELRRNLRAVRGDRDGVVFLVARMLYTDGLATLMVFTGVYTVGVLGWTALDLLAFGLIVSVAAVFGGLAAGRLDQAFGPKRAIAVELAVCIVGAVAQLGMGRDRLFFLPFEAEPVWNGPVFRTLPELAYVGVGLFTAAAICAVFASSRTLLVRIAPPERLGGYLGLFALSGQATAWLGPLLVGVATAAFASQRAGFAIILVLLIAGLLGLLRVRGGGPLAPPNVGRDGAKRGSGPILSGESA